MIKSLLYFVIAFFLTFLLLEGYMRLAEIETVSVTDFDPEIGRVMTPNQPFAYYNENFTVGSYNKYGYLGPAYPKNRSDSVIRIALLGDSYVEGFQVQPRNHFRSILEKTLRDQLDNPAVQVLNFGRSGFDLANSYAYDQMFVSDFDPDITVYFLAVSDLEQSKDDPLLPHWNLENKKLKMSYQFQKTNYLEKFQMAKHGLQNSSILQMLNNDLKLIARGQAPHIILEKLARWWYPEEDESTDVSHQADRVSLAIIQNVGRRPDAVIVNRDSIAFPTKVQHAIQKAGIPLLNVADTLKVMEVNGVDGNAWEATGSQGHWNHAGHQAVGMYLSRRLLPILQKDSQHREFP